MKPVSAAAAAETAAELVGREQHIAPAPRVSVQAFCETVEPPAPVQGASAHPDGRVDRGHRSLSELTDAQRHHAGNGKPQRRYPRRPRSAARDLRCRHARRRHRAHERRHAVSRAGAARRQRLPDLASRPVADRALGVRPVLGARRQAGRPHHRRGRGQGRRRSPPPSRTTSRSPSPTTSSSMRS